MDLSILSTIIVLMLIEYIKGINMSELESIFWHVLGYAAIPTIFVIGFVGVFFVAVGILKVCGKTPVED